MTISTLPNELLLGIFYLFLEKVLDPIKTEQFVEDNWHTLVKVCQRWRYLVFAHPKYLDLRLLFTMKRQMEKMLDIWPALPIVIKADISDITDSRQTDVFAALGQHDRLREIKIWKFSNSLWRSSMESELLKPFPVLTSLVLQSDEKRVPTLPDSFLGGSAPRLRSLWLSGIPFPALPRLLSSTNNLVDLHLWQIPRSGYISPDEMVTSLSVLKKLKSLLLRFRSPRSQAHQASQHLPPPTRVVLPALTILSFKGDSEYLEEFVSRIDSPLLDETEITFFNQSVFDTPRLCDFISRTETSKATSRADILFSNHQIGVSLYRLDYRKVLQLGFPSDGQLSSLAQVYSSSLPPLPTLEHLGIHEKESSPVQWHGHIQGESTQWLELLRPFIFVKKLVLSEKLVPFVAPVLQELVGERVTEVLPALQNLSLEGQPPSGPAKEAIGQFIAARQLIGRPVAVHKH